MYFLFFASAGVLCQHLPDAVQEEGVLLDAVPLEVCLELLKQLGGHLKSYPPMTDELALLRGLGDMGGVNLRLTARQVTPAPGRCLFIGEN